jgi:hypothetical protein
MADIFELKVETPVSVLFNSSTLPEIAVIKEDTLTIFALTSSILL